MQAGSLPQGCSASCWCEANCRRGALYTQVTVLLSFYDLLLQLLFLPYSYSYSSSYSYSCSSSYSYSYSSLLQSLLPLLLLLDTRYASGIMITYHFLASEYLFFCPWPLPSEGSPRLLRERAATLPSSLLSVSFLPCAQAVDPGSSTAQALGGGGGTP